MVFLLCVSCAQKEKWEVYKDPNYPITIDYIADPKKMEVTPTLVGEDPVLKQNGVVAEYRIDVEADFSEVHPNAEVLEGAYEIEIYKHEEDFKKMVKFAYKKPVQQETLLNDTPAILISDPEHKYEEYILLFPGEYVSVYLDGLSASEKITREALKHFHWTQPIDTTTPEFKAWKAHIWEILNAPPPASPKPKGAN